MKVALLCLAFGQVAEMVPEAEVVKACAADVARMKFPTRTRYLSVGHLSPAQRETMRAVLNVHCNHLSTEPSIARLGSGGIFLRLNLDDYAWSDSTWEKLVDVEPWFHAKADLVDVYESQWTWNPNLAGTYIDAQGKTWSGRWVETKVRQRTGTVFGPWVVSDEASKAALASLVAATGTKAPIVRADWFLWQTALQADRAGTGYYDWLGIKSQKDYFRLAGFDAKLMRESKRSEWLEAVSDSGISQQPRRIGAFPTIGELRLWRTFDNREATEKRNPLRVLDDNFQFDASEEFASLPNGLWMFGLFDAKGNNQETAPDFIGFDRTTHSNDGRIHVGLSCIRCHYKNDGLNPIKEWARNLYRPPIGLTALEETKFRQLKSQYLRDLEGVLKRDRDTFKQTMVREFGMEPGAYAKAFAEAFAAYDRPRTLDEVARDVGTAPGLFVQKVLGRVKAGVYVDPLLVGLTLPEKRRQAIPVRQYHEVLPQAFEVARN